MTQITYSTLTPGAPENVNDLNTRLTELKTVINGNIDSGNLAANSVGTSELVDGSVTTAKLASAVGAPLAVVTSQLVGATGQASVIAPGRTLSATDFTGMGLTTPAGLYNLASTTDASGNGRTLTNKGSVVFTATGITGSASTAALFTGSTAQALSSSDASFQLKTGSWGGWQKTGKRSTAQTLVGKFGAAGQRAYQLEVNSNNLASAYIYTDGTTILATANSASDVADGNWHHLVATFDGTTLRIYVDGVLESATSGAGTLFAGNAPMAIGARSLDSTITTEDEPHYGAIDEVFVTADVLTDDQVRFLYCSKVAHAYPSTPKQSWIQVYRYRRGAALATTDFPATPVRLHNFTAGALTDAGSGGVSLTNNNTALSVAGADGTQGNAFNFVAGSSQSLSSTDTGLPSGTSTRSYGCWFKTTLMNNDAIMSWGSGVTTAAQALYVSTTGAIIARGPSSDDITGPFAADGQWHFAVVVEDNSATDAVKRKLYLDGRCVTGATALNSITLAGANRFRIGSWPDASGFYTGQVDGAFVTTSALTAEQIAVLYQKSSQSLSSSPKNEGDHIEGADSTYLYLDMSSLSSNSLVDIQVQG